jgi:hypothetical protein
VLTHESVFHFHLWHVWPDSIKMHEERASRQKDDETVPKGAIPAYLLDREGESRSKVRGQQRIRPCSALRYATVGAYLGRVCVCVQVLSNMVKQKRKEKAGKWSVPLPQVKGVAEDEVFKVLTTGKKRSTDAAVAPSPAYRWGCVRRRQEDAWLTHGWRRGGVALTQPSSGSGWSPR